jgi:uncharacterized membrane protein
MSQLADALSTAEQNAPKPAQGLNAKTVLWIAIWSAIVFVLVSNELLLIADYPLYHAYRTLLIADRYKLVPHATFGSLALLIGPLQFSTWLRRRYVKLHRVLGRIYVVSVGCASVMALTISWGRPLMPATLTQVIAWITCTTLAFVTARNRQIAQHRAWMMRSYAVTLTFITTRILSLWPAYWNLSDQAEVIVIIAFVVASLLVVDVGLSWREITTARR